MPCLVRSRHGCRVAVRSPLTFHDLDELAEDGRSYELIDGALVVTPVPGVFHQIVVGALYRLLWAARTPGAAVVTAPVDFVPEETSSFQPDVVVIEEAEAAEPRLTRTPLLVVEVLSPSSRSQDLGAKRLAYAKARVPSPGLLAQVPRPDSGDAPRASRLRARGGPAPGAQGKARRPSRLR